MAEYDVSQSLKRKQQDPSAAVAAGAVKRIKYQVDASAQQDAIAKYRQMKAMQQGKGGKGKGGGGPKHGKQRLH